MRVDGHGGSDRRVVCSSAPACGFVVKAYRRSKIVDGKRVWLEQWHVSTAELEHNDCFSVAKPTERQIASMKEFSSALRFGSAVKASALINQVRETKGVSLSKMKRTVYRAMDRVREEDHGDMGRSFGKIASYLEVFSAENPGTIAVAEKDDESRFKRAVVVVGPFINAKAACQKIVGIDCSHSKSRYFSGVQVHFVGRDGNMKNITLAFGLVPAEDSASYLWFLDKVAAVESVFGSQLVSGIRHLAPFEFLERLCEKLVTDAFDRAANAERWRKRGSEVTPGAKVQYDKQAADLGVYLVIKSCNDVSFVINKQVRPRTMRRVTFSTRTCTCSYMDQNGIPCRHLIAALAEHNKEAGPEYFHEYYRVDSYHTAFSGVAIRLPLDTQVIEDPSWKPPQVKSRAGRPKMKRIRSNGEENFK